MTRRYSALSLLREGLAGHTGWEPAWRSPQPQKSYDAIVIGGGGHGLATAYYLAKTHRLTRVAVLEKGWIGGGNTGRNTTVVRSNYFYPESVALYALAHRLYKGLAAELNFNVMFSPRGMVSVCHSDAEMELAARTVNAMQINGVDAELFSAADVRRVAPPLNFSPTARFPIHGGVWQGSAGTARHDAVAWGYARAASALGVDIIQNCEVEAIRRDAAGAVSGLETTRGAVATKRIGVVAAGNTSVVMAMAGVRLPLESFPLQALVSEPLKPVMPCVVMSNTIHAYMSQSDKGELVIGAGTDAYVSYSQTGGLHIASATLEAICEMFPIASRVRMMRNWGGIVDTTPDRSPIVGKTPVPGLFVNCGWGTGGFKATPGSGQLFAHQMATGEPHPIAAPFSLERFRTGALVNEATAAAVAH